MADPVPSLYENDSTPSGGTVINAGNPIAFGNVPKGTASEPSDSGKYPIHLWNDKGGSAGSVDMKQVKIGVKNSLGGNAGEFISGTVLNGNQPFFEAKSSGAYGITDDAQSAFTRIGGDTFLDVGDIPSNCRRSILVKLNVAPDATVGSQVPQLVVDYTFDA